MKKLIKVATIVAGMVSVLYFGGGIVYSLFGGGSVFSTLIAVPIMFTLIWLVVFGTGFLFTIIVKLFISPLQTLSDKISKP